MALRDELKIVATASFNRSLIQVKFSSKENLFLNNQAHEIDSNVFPIAIKNERSKESPTLIPAINAPRRTAGQNRIPFTNKIARAKPPGIQKIVTFPLSMEKVSTIEASTEYTKAINSSW